MSVTRLLLLLRTALKAHLRSPLLLAQWSIFIALTGAVSVQARTAATRATHTKWHKIPSQVMRILTFDGAIKATEEKTLFTPYAKKENLTLLPFVWNGTIEELSKQENKTPDRWSAVMMETSTLRISCSLNLLVRDPADSSNNSCGQPFAHIDYAMAWERSYFDAQPDWSDFWDVARHPGQRSLRRDPRTTLEIALLADGVPANAIYNVLSSREGLERAFRKLDQIRPYIVWWTTPAEATDIMRTRGALMGSVPAGDILSLPPQERSHFGLSQNQRLAVSYSWGVPITLKPNHAALTLVSWLELPEQQSAFSNAWPDLNSEDTQTRHVPLPLYVSDSFWETHLTDISARFERWINGQNPWDN